MVPMLRKVKGRAMRNYTFSFEMFFFLQEKLQTMRLCKEAQRRHNEMNQKHKLGEVPKAALIAHGQLSLLSAWGIREVGCTTRPTLPITPAPKHRNKAATDRIQGIRVAGKEPY